MNEQEWIDKMLDPRLRAGWGSRIISFFYDLVYLFLIMFFISALTTLWMLITIEPPYEMDILEIRQYLIDFHPELLLIDRLIKVIIFFAYFFFIPLLGHDHRTFGMLTTGVSLMNEKGEEVTRKQYLLRELYKWTLFLGFFLVFKKEKQTLHDQLSKTYMVLN